MPLTLTYIAPCAVPVEVDGLTPDKLMDCSLKEISALPVYVGNRQVACGELFRVEGSASDGHVRWCGDLRGVHWIGAKMGHGSIVVEGSAGRHVGSGMSGGRIEVIGDVSDWLGAEMHGGWVHVRGRAGHLVGSAYRGSRRGMTAGTIIVEGAAGNEIGHTMRRGCIVIGGNAGDLVGFNILAGTILILGDSGIRHGAGMHRGTIGLFGHQPPPMLPTFRPAGKYSSPWLPLLGTFLAAGGYSWPIEDWQRQCQLFHGDLLENGRGEILTRV
ncbi:MAG: formylmethanofuran dehydrogenase subunit C [Planctomycetota bacterium]|nr:formylmethanofuran dehydrogenase subunit C [Planctomycetota bacterium]MDA1177717.1 formylmethanofuran dehydrogenase subunit C [Planctomycetota bacterium]